MSNVPPTKIIENLNPSNSLEFVVLIICIAVLGGFFMWLRMSKDNSNAKSDNVIVMEIQLLQNKLENLISSIKSKLDGDYTVLKNRVDYNEKSLEDFKAEMRKKL